ncbi:Beta-D-glucosyl crocetin beta-1,6-glucosyltransferase, partial [Cucurbita argyrosperma subsp. argyrosperma]
MFQPWAVHSAAALNIPTVFFLVVGAGTFSHSVHSVLHHGVDFPFPELDLKNHWLFKRHQNDPSDSSVSFATSRFVQLVKDLEVYSDVVLVNSFVEIESKKKVVPVGPLVALSDEKSDVLDWLDQKEPKSTVYVSFGSEYYLSNEDRAELAMGLEMSGANFIWVIRFGKGESVGIREALPEGFIERVGERGLVVDGWAPQMGILKHTSIGGFVCHCGWNSVVEAAVNAVPIIALPMQLDQPFHGKVAVAAGVAVEAARGVDGAVQREGVAKAIKEVLFEKKGEKLSGKAKEICESLKVKDGKNIDTCVVEISRILESGKN